MSQTSTDATVTACAAVGEERAGTAAAHSTDHKTSKKLTWRSDTEDSYTEDVYSSMLV